MDPHPFKLILALLIFVFLWATYTQRVPTAFMVSFPITAMLMFGAASGFAAGTTNVMVAVLIIYFLAIDLPRPTMVPIMNTCFGAGKNRPDHRAIGRRFGELVIGCKNAATGSHRRRCTDGWATPQPKDSGGHLQTCITHSISRNGRDTDIPIRIRTNTLNRTKTRVQPS